MKTTWATTMKILVIGDNAIGNKGNNEDIHDNNLFGEKKIQKLIVLPKPYKKNKTTMAMTIYLENKRSLNSSLLQKTREAQT
jgi:hypothetical protein